MSRLVSVPSAIAATIFSLISIASYMGQNDEGEAALATTVSGQKIAETSQPTDPDIRQSEKSDATALIGATAISATDESTTSQSSGLLGTYYVTANSLNERDAPNGEVVNKVYRGQALKVTEIRDGWAQVSDKGGSPNWVSLKYLSRDKPAPTSQIAAQDSTNVANQPLSVSFENYDESGSKGGNLRVDNSASTTFATCSITLGDSGNRDRWYLPKPTVLDAEGHRSYPTFMFRDRKGQTPPTPAQVASVDIVCGQPQLTVSLDLSVKGAISADSTALPKNDATSPEVFPALENRHKTTQDHGKIGWMQRGMKSVELMLRDPSSADFRNVFFHRGIDNVPMTCGEVNSKNGFGAYAGFQLFVSAGTVDLTFLEQQVRDFSNIWARFCTE